MTSGITISILFVTVGAVCLLKGKRQWGIAVVALPTATIVLGRLSIISESKFAQLAGILGLALIATTAAAVSAAIERAKPGSWWARHVRDLPPVSSLPPLEARRRRFVVARRRVNYTIGAFSVLMWVPHLACQGVECDIWFAFLPMVLFFGFALLIGNVVASRVHAARMARGERTVANHEWHEPAREMVS